MAPAPDALHEALASSQRLGMLGARPIAEVVEHAGAFVTALDDVSGTIIDLGTGGGVPGLVIAAARPDLQVVLVDRRTVRTDHVRRVVRGLGWDDRVTVLTADAGAVVLDPLADAVVARGFGPPQPTLAVAARLVRPGGLVVISEPPQSDPERWPPAALGAVEVSRVPSPDARVAMFVRDVPRGT